MSTTEEATINPDGSQTFGSQEGGADQQQQEMPPTSSESQTPPGGEDETMFGDAEGAEGAADLPKGIDPAIIFLLIVAVLAVSYYWFVIRRKAKQPQDHFFNELDGDKFNLALPVEVEQYYAIKNKCEDDGWVPGQGQPQKGSGQPPSAQHRVLAQALMKRAVADIPIVQHIQKESNGMNRLYSSSMCSVNQWRAYQNAETLVSSEVADVRAEADELEPGWGPMIWRQAMQYHQMLKQKHEAEAKAVEEAAAKKNKKKIEPAAAAAASTKASAAEQQQQPKKKKAPVDTEKERELAAERAAQELITEEERSNDAKKAFGAGNSKMKKGFLNNNNNGKGKKK